MTMQNTAFYVDKYKKSIFFFTKLPILKFRMTNRKFKKKYNFEIKYLDCVVFET